MTLEQLSQWMRHPETLGSEQVAELRKLCEEFPYFSISRMLLSKALRNSNDLLFDSETRKTYTYCHDRRKLFFLLYPVVETKTAGSNPLYNDVAGDYFSLHELETATDDPSQSLKSLAQKLKEARMQKKAAEPRVKPVVKAEVPPEIKKEAPVTISQPAPQNNPNENPVYTEQEAIRLIKEKKFEEALKILRVLHLNIPEKSVYFADQIRYIEKIIATINKS